MTTPPPHEHASILHESLMIKKCHPEKYFAKDGPQNHTPKNIIDGRGAKPSKSVVWRMQTVRQA
jgi:hypothetical protein